MWIDVTEREAAQAELRESEERFRSCFEKSTDPFLLFDGEGMVDCNLAARRLFNCEGKEQMLGRTLEDLSPERQADGHLTQKKAVVLFGKTLTQGDHRTEWTVRALNGRDIPVELSLGTVKLEGKNLIFMVLGILRNGKKLRTSCFTRK
jgi:PAS domain S-box-containing protein